MKRLVEFMSELVAIAFGTFLVGLLFGGLGLMVYLTIKKLWP